jgi:arsenical pump membrane protein
MRAPRGPLSHEVPPGAVRLRFARAGGSPGGKKAEGRATDFQQVSGDAPPTSGDRRSVPSGAAADRTGERPEGRGARARVGVLDAVAVGLLGLGVAFVLVGALPLSAAEASLRRIADILVFLVAVVVLSELLAAAQLFDVVARPLVIWGRGRFAVLFGVCVLLASATTMVLNLDTTAVLLTPVMVALARQASVPPLPFAMATVWFANLASLLLPVSNLTNLLAADRVGLTPLGFAERMAVPQAVALAVGSACLWLFYWRRGVREQDRYHVPGRLVPRDRRLVVVAAADVVVFATAVLTGVPLWLAAVACAAVVVTAFGVLDRARLRIGLVPWRLVVMVVGLFLVVGTVDRWGLERLLREVVGASSGAAGVWRAGAAGAVLSNLVNNLPAYVAGETAIAPGDHDQLLGLLVGVNLGPLVAPWAALATLIWFDTVRREGVGVPLGRFLGTSALTAVVTLAAALGALVLTR